MGDGNGRCRYFRDNLSASRRQNYNPVSRHGGRYAMPVARASLDRSRSWRRIYVGCLSDLRTHPVRICLGRRQFCIALVAPLEILTSVRIDVRNTQCRKTCYMAAVSVMISREPRNHAQVECLSVPLCWFFSSTTRVLPFLFTMRAANNNTDSQQQPLGDNNLNQPVGSR